MFWIGFIVGIFSGLSLGIVVAGLLWSSKKTDTEAHFNPHADGWCRDRRG